MKQDSKNVVIDASDDADSEEESSTSSATPRADDSETGTEESNPKRRRRGRRGGRRRRRRSDESVQVDENQNVQSQTGDINASQASNDGLHETPKEPTKQQDDGTAETKPTRGRRRGRSTAKAGAKIGDSVNSPTANGSAVDHAVAASPDTSISNGAALDDDATASETNSNIARIKKPARTRKKRIANAETTDADHSTASADETQEISGLAAKAKKPTKKAALSRKAKGEVALTADQPANKKRPAAKKPARKAAKKTPLKPEAKAKAKAADADNAAASKKPPSREALSSAPQDVVEIGSKEPQSPRRGWWSRS